MNETISLKELLLVLKKRLVLIVIITAIVTSMAGIVSYFLLTPIYQSSTQILVNQSKSDSQAYNYNEVQANLQLINTYKFIIRNSIILDKVIEQEQLNTTVPQLIEQISVSNEQNSQVVNITVKDKDPQVAANIANSIASTFETEISTIMNVESVKILTTAKVGENPSPVEPKPILIMGIALFVSSMIAIGLSFLLEYFNTSIKTEKDIESHLDLPVLGSITTINMEEKVKGQPSVASTIKARGETVGS